MFDHPYSVHFIINESRQLIFTKASGFISVYTPKVHQLSNSIRRVVLLLDKIAQ